MKKGNVVNMLTYCNNDEISITKMGASSISQELEQAIQHLIHRLRELGPIQKVN
jgi:hypothetical protein